MKHIIESLQVGTKLSRLEQRTIDVLIEKKLFNRHIISANGTQEKFNYLCKISFVEQVDYEKNSNLSQTLDARVVPFFTRAVEPVAHILIPRMAEYGYVPQIVPTPEWTTVHIADKTNLSKNVAFCTHEEYPVAMSVACLRALYPKDLSHVFETTKNFIAR